MSEQRRIDPDAVRAHTPIATLIGQFVSLTRDGREFKAICPFHKEKTPSFYVVPDKGFFHCHGCSAHGDGIDFVMRHLQVPFRQACSIIAGENIAPLPVRNRRTDPDHEPTPDIYDSYVPVVPVPDTVPALQAGHRTPKILNIKRQEDPDQREKTYVPKMVHPYRAADGGLIGYVLRIEFQVAGKRVKLPLQIMWCDLPDGGQQWCLRKFPVPRPLYGLDDLAADTVTDVLVVEGEKAKDAARARLSDHFVPPFVVVSWPGGTGGVGKVDWSPLRGRNVTIWPDADEPGVKAAAQIAAILS